MRQWILAWQVWAKPSARDAVWLVGCVSRLCTVSLAHRLPGGNSGPGHEKAADAGLGLLLWGLVGGAQCGEQRGLDLKRSETKRVQEKGNNKVRPNAWSKLKEERENMERTRGRRKTHGSNTRIYDLHRECKPEERPNGGGRETEIEEPMSVLRIRLERRAHPGGGIQTTGRERITPEQT